MVGKELSAKEREKVVQEIREAKAAGAIPVNDLVKALEDYLFIVDTFDLD